MAGAWLWRVVGIVLLSCLVLGEVTATAGRETKNFDTDVRKILDIIIHSLYTNRGVFLRELVSNASDALDKIRFKYLTSPQEPKNDKGEAPTLDIRIAVDRTARTITIRDGGCGMSKAELAQFLGTIGSSGTKKFLEAISAGKSTQDSMALIGQFGVGFYSAYLIADNVRVASKSDDDTVQYVWESAADGSYSIYPDPRGNTLGRGTEITIDVKADADEFLEVARVRELAQKYSEFISYPILMQETRTEKRPKSKKDDEKVEEKAEDAENKDDDDDKEDEKEEEEEVTVEEWKQVNEQKPIWTRKAEDLKDEDYHAFYRAISKDSEDPLSYAHFSAEGEVDFRALLFIPGKAPAQQFDGVSQTLTNIRLYVRRVFITDDFKDLLPRYLNFIKGVVDSDDLPLNVSRELLQESRIIKVIKKKLVRKILALFKDLADEDAKHEADVEQAKKDGTEPPAEKESKFIKLWEEYGRALRLGLIEDSQNRARLVKLLRYKSTKSPEKYISLEQYVDRMPEEQKDIYYIVGPGEDATKLAQNPALQGAVRRGYDVLLMTDAIDEYAVGHVTEFAGKRFVNMAKEDLKLPEKNEARQKRIKEAREKAWKPTLDWLRGTLGGQVERVLVSERLTDSPAVLVTPRYGMTQTMYRIIKASPLGEQNTQPEPKKILEINHRHPLVISIRDKAAANADDPQAKTSAQLLYDSAAVEGGFSVDSVPAFVSRVHVAIGHMLGVAPDSTLAPEDDDTLVPPDTEEDSKEEGASKEEEGAKVEVDEAKEAKEEAAGEL